MSSYLFPVSALQFRPRLVPTVAALLAVLLTLYLSNWQRGRAEEKRALQAAFDQRANMPALALAESAKRVESDSRYRAARASGVYDTAGQIFIDNKSHGTTVGYHVVTPLKLANAERYVLVNRGFIPRGPQYPLPPIVSVPSGSVEINGMLSQLSNKFLELGVAAPQNAVWQNLTVDRYRAATNRDVLPLVLLANPTNDGLIAQTERPDAGVDKHVEYMLTWLSLAITVVILWVALNLKIRRASSSSKNDASAIT
jgi:surfeit locus 1 family protein